MVVWIQGFPNVGKTTIGKELLCMLNNGRNEKKSFIMLDGDDFRSACGNDLGHTLEDRNRNAERIIGIVKMLSSQVDLVVCANLTSPEYQEIARNTIDEYFDIYLYADRETLLERDSDKKVYNSAAQAETGNIVIRDVPVSHPENPYMFIDTSFSTGLLPENIVQKIYNKLFL